MNLIVSISSLIFLVSADQSSIDADPNQPGSGFADGDTQYFYEVVGKDYDLCFRSIRDRRDRKQFTQICHNREEDLIICCRPSPTPPDETLFDYRHADEDLKDAWDEFASLK